MFGFWKAKTKPGLHHRNRHSIFLKLIGIFLLAGLLLNLLGFGFFRLGRSWQEENRLEDTVLFLLESAILRLGTPPDRALALQMKEQQDLAIAYSPDPEALVPDMNFRRQRGESPDSALDASNGAMHDASFNFLNPRSDFEEEDFYLNTGNVLDFHEGQLTARIRRPEGTFWIQYQFGGPDGNPWGILAFLITLSGVLLLAYSLMRRTLKPIKALMTGVQETSRGNLDYRIKLHRRDELGQLASLYNDMQGKIQSMLESRRQLLLDVSHEIRTPLTRMKLSLEFIPESRRTEALKEEIRLLDTMLTEVLENERLSSLHGALQPRYQSLEPMLQRCIQRFSVAGIRIEHSLEDVSASYDEARMAIAIQNLLENAVRHTDPQNRSISLDLQRDGDTAIITIQDNGTGIPEKEKDRIFEPFYRKAAKPSEKPIQESGSSAGFGLGLSLVHRIVESHGGTIQLESSTDHGSKFTIRIPLTRSRAE